MNMSKIEESAALNIHKRAIKEGEDYAKSHGQSPMEEVAYGRGFKSGYILGAKEFSEKAINWLRERVNIPYNVETNEDGEPLADSYIDYAKKRLEAANEIIEEFIKSMTE
jgi:hypothetical protein